MKSKLLAWTAVVLWMAVIFHLSAQVADVSNQLSEGLTEVIVETVERVVPSADIAAESLNHIVRKHAHFFAYLVLGVLTINALRTSGVKGTWGVAVALLICVVYAVSDEVHQLFVPGRGGQVTDVIIDSAGATVGLCIYRLGCKAVTRLQDRAKPADA